MFKSGQPIRIALAHDSFTQLGGAERVIEELHRLFPDAPVYTLVLDKKLAGHYKGWDIRTSWLQPFYNLLPKLQYWLPFIPSAVSSLDFKDFDAVISNSSSFIKNIRTPKNCVHISYCHTPTRFLWVNQDYVNQEVPGILRPLVKVLLSRMRKWDYESAQRPNYFFANSKEVQKRIKRHYNRDSEVLYPFIDTQFWHPTRPKQDYFLLAGRLQAHKHNDLVVEIFSELGIPLHVAGTGRQEAYLKDIAGKNISFLGRITDEQLRDEYSGALGYVYPQLEDFGLMPLEAASCGTATIALAQGGSLETVIPAKTGELFADYDKEKIKKIILDWKPGEYPADVLRKHAETFGKENFKQKLYGIVKSLTQPLC
jgi:glycosyltransferase involved in cell wall biosynthesis